MELCEQALERGVYAQGIRYPSVPEQAARLRFTPMCSHTAAEIETVVEIFRELR
jgi:7-keto-8-aminopelargonate synthetase-like enzyme